MSDANRLVRARRIALRAGLALAVFALALLLRLRAAEVMTVDFDEDDYLRAGQLYAQHLAAGDLRGVIDERENYEHPPLTKLAYGAILAAQGPASYAEPVTALKLDQLPRGADMQRVRELVPPLRRSGAVVGALTAGLVALASPLAGLLVALSSWQIQYTSSTMLEALPTLFAALCLLALQRSRRNGDIWFWLGAVALGLTAAGTYRYAAGGFAALIYLVGRQRSAVSSQQSAAGLRPSPPAPRLTPPAASLILLGWLALALLVFYAANPAIWLDPIGRLRDSLLFNADFSTSEHVRRAGFPWFQPLLWMLGASPWQQGAIPLRLDGAFGLLALLALPGMWRAGGALRLTTLWLLANLLFLLIWPTKWPQYALALTVPAALAAAHWLGGLPARWRGRPRWSALERRELRRATPWLWPTALLLLAVAAYPLILQIGMAVSDFQARNIRPGQLAFWEALLRGALTLPPMAGNPLEFYGLGPVALSGWLIEPLRFNVIWVAVSMALATALALWLAGLLQRRGLRGRAAWRSLFILPWAIPEFVGALIWSTIFDENFGALNNLTGVPVKWLSDPTPLLDLRIPVRPIRDLLETVRLAPIGDTLFFLAESLSPPKPFWVLVLVSVWVCFPFMLLISSAALRGIPDEIYDAARVDGASGWTLWRRITWPMIAPAIWGGVLLRGALLFNAFYLPQMLIGLSNVERAGTVPLALIGYYAITNSDYVFAAYINTAILAAAAGLLWLFNRQTRVVEGSEK